MSTVRLVTLFLTSLGCLSSVVVGSDDVADQLKSAEPVSAVRLNSIGYLPDTRKVATLAQPADEFIVVSVEQNETLLRGKVLPAKGLKGDSKPLWHADFTQLNQPGTYQIVVPETGQSCDFAVNANIYNQPFFAAMRAMYLWRCGCAVSGHWQGDHFHHQSCHTAEGLLDHVGKPGLDKDGSGGWHDAGDYNKYTVNGSFAAGLMLHTWLQHQKKLEGLSLDLPDEDPVLPDYLEEVKWQIDWLLKMQAADGRVYHKLSTEEFSGMIKPENETVQQYFCPWGTAATADFVAVTALASRVFRPYKPEFADRCLEASQKSYQFLRNHPEDHRPDQSAFKTGQYDSPDADDRVWAAAELWEATGEEEHLADLEARLREQHHAESLNTSMVSAVWDWANLQNLGVFTYMLSQRTGRDAELLRQAREDLLASADTIIGKARRHPYNRSLGDRYYWGSNGTVARQTLNLQLAYLLSGDEIYRSTMLDALNFLFGRNHYGRSFVTGLGHIPPKFPHDRRSGADDVLAPWPGYLIGGPWPKATDWIDHEEDYKTNEFAINWNASLIHALAAFVEPTTFAEDTSDHR